MIFAALHLNYNANRCSPNELQTLKPIAMPTHKKLYQWLNDLPIRYKLLALTGFVASLSLCVAVAAVTFIDWQLHQSLMEENAHAQAEIVAINSDAVLQFNDKLNAEKNLSPLLKVEGIAAAALFTEEKQKFAEYQRSQQQSIDVQALLKDEPYQDYKGSQLIVQKTISVQGKVVGYLLIVNDLKPFFNSLYWVWFLSIAVVFISLILGWLLFQKMQRIITAPVQNLSRAMSEVTQQQDYSLRIQVHSEDELGHLARGFNNMLQQIEKRDKKLEIYNRDLEQAVKQRTQALAITVESLVEAKDKAEKANKAKSRFLANVSHELRTPLNAILGFAEILHQKCKTNLELKYISIILGSGKTLLNLINEILDLARIEAGKLKLEYTVVDLRQLLNDVYGFFTPKLDNKDIVLKLDIANNLPAGVMLDPIRVQQILINLVGNAVKFTAHGYVRLALEIKWLNTAKTLLELHLIVEDTGIGIPETEQERIFRAFEQQEQQSPNQYGGTGLGLAITKNLVDIMQGEIKLRSKPHQGSCFTVIFHEVEVPAALPTPHKLLKNHQDIRFSPANIIIADDIEMNRELLKAYLAKYPFKLIEAQNGQEVLDKVKQNKIDLILLDIKMPIMSGEEVAKQLKSSESTAYIPIIAVTAHAMQEDVERYRYLCDDYLPKPVAQELLKSKLAQFLAHKETQVETEVHETQEPSPTSMPEVLAKVLNTEYKKQWQALDQYSAINTISDFAQLIIKLAQQHEYQPLLNWGIALSESADSFDVSQIHKMLEKFEDFLSCQS